MKKIGENILCWCEAPEQGAIDQAINLSKHPFLVGNVCLMPDTHCGFGMPIGGVVALDNAVSPNMIGVDEFCGMLATRTTLTEISTENIKKIMGLIRERVPVGFKHHAVKQENDIFDKDEWGRTKICSEQFERAQYQLGTLGGGNHFIEIQKGSDGYIWFMLHSGSRNLGKRVADNYNKVAVELCERWKYDELIKNELCVIPNCQKEFEEFLSEMRVCAKFALANRKLMAKRIMESFADIIPDVDFEEQINIHHNYATIEHHFGRDVWVHRKGATLAREGTIGIIPGSQGTSSYIVRGKGNEASMCSCSHGAGRRMSRKKATEELDLAKEQEILNSKGIIHAIRNTKDLEEASSAYKDIDVVMKEQEDLVDILVKLEPLAVIKG